MDFLNPHKKRAHRIRLLVGYLLVAVALAMGTIILVLLSYGYGYDRKTGEVIQKSIVFVGAKPDSADIYINGERQSARTNTKLLLQAGQYSMQLKRDGYRDWSRTFSLQGGGVEHLEYPLLFPNKLVTKDVELYASQPSFATQSPDHHWLLIQQVGQLLKFDVMDVSSDSTPVTTITLPPSVIAAAEGAQSWQLVEWSTDNRHVLLEHVFDGSSEFIMIDRENPALSFNVARLFGLAPSNVAMRDKNYDQLYLYSSDKSLQIGDVKAVRVTPFLTHVLAFKAHGDKTVLYVSDQNVQANKVDLRLYSDGKNYTLRKLAVSDIYLLDLAQFDSRWYMVASVPSEGRTYIYRDPENILKSGQVKNPVLLPAIVLAINKPEYLSFSESARFVAVQSGSHFAVYDAESDRRYYYDVEPALEKGRQANWMDGNRLSTATDGKALVFDFDGTNKQTLVAAQPSMPLFFDKDYKWLYTLAPSITVSGRAAITRTDLVIK